VDDQLTTTLTRLAPGSVIRDAIERVMHAGRGTLLLLGDNPEAGRISSGGFHLDVDTTAQRVAELAKMDGAIVLSEDLRRIRAANVHLMPDPHVPTLETGTRHRTAERVARQLQTATVAVSASTRSITVYVAGQRHVLDDVHILLSRANQALATLERYRSRLDEHLNILTNLELEDGATLRDVAVCLQRAEMVSRIGREVRTHVALLGTEGRLVQLQLNELEVGTDIRTLLLADYHTGDDQSQVRSLERLERLADDKLLDLDAVAGVVTTPDGRLDRTVTATGARILTHVPRLPPQTARTLAATFGSAAALADASETTLAAVPGVGPVRARRVTETIERLRNRR